MKLKLGYFATGQSIQATLKSSTSSSLFHLAPEIIDNLQYDPKCSDVYRSLIFCYFFKLVLIVY